MATKDDRFEVRERRRFTGGGSDTTPAADAPDIGDTKDENAAESTAGQVLPDEDSLHGEGTADNIIASTSEPASVGSSADADGAEDPEPRIEDVLGADGDSADAPMPEISAAAFLQFVLASLHEMAWQKMGLLPNPSTGKLESKLSDARLAIDGFGALLSVLSSHLDERASREMHTTLSNLRLNFVEQSAKKEKGS